MGKKLKSADHENRVVRDVYDDSAEQFVALDGDKIIGAMRMILNPSEACLADHDLVFPLDRFRADFPNDPFVIASRLVVDPGQRGQGSFLLLMQEAYCRAFEAKARLGLIPALPNLADLYHAMGCLPVGRSNSGMLTLACAVQNTYFLSSLSSLLLRPTVPRKDDRKMLSWLDGIQVEDSHMAARVRDYRLTRVENTVAEAGQQLATMLKKTIPSGGLTRERYIRYLSMQYHLTNGVQRHFLEVSAHPRLRGKRALRDFLYHFGLEEEPHFELARRDLAKLGEQPLPCPLDVHLWWAFHDQMVSRHPFMRLGATCVLENLGSYVSTMAKEMFAKADFLNEGNTTFLVLHMHEILPHGKQIVAALKSVRLGLEDVDELETGALLGAILYLRMARWALEPDANEAELIATLPEDNGLLAALRTSGATLRFDELDAADATVAA
jgi:hypothetical protein